MFWRKNNFIKKSSVKAIDKIALFKYDNSTKKGMVVCQLRQRRMYLLGILSENVDREESKKERLDTK